MAIQESIELTDSASAPLNAAADAAGSFADAMDDARSAADLDASGAEDLADATDDVADAASDAADGMDDVGDAARDAGKGGTSAFESMGEALQSVNAGMEIAKKAYQAAAAVGKIVVAFGEAVIEAHGLRSAATAALDAVTNGRGAEALEHLSGVARGLGVDVQDVASQFADLRKAGASNADATALIKLRADLDAVGVSAGDADAAVADALAQIKGGGKAADVIADVAEGFGAVGDGANAAAKRALTLEGALANAKNAGARAFDSIAAAAGPALDRAGAKITSVLDSLEDSGAIESFAEGFADAVEAIPPIIDEILVGWEAFKGAIEPGLEGLRTSWTVLSEAMGDAEGGMSTASVIGQALGAVFNLVANGIAGAITAAGLFVGAVNWIVDGANSIIDTVEGIPDALSSISLSEIGSNLVESFISGMESMIGSVIASASGLGDAAGSAIKSALGIASPSKVGLEIGENLGDSVATGTAETMPDAIDPPELSALPELPPANTNAAAAAPAASSAPIVINVHALPGQSVQEIAREVERRIELRRRAG